MFKFYGYSRNNNEDTPIELEEISVLTNPELLEKLGQFLLSCTSEIKVNKKWDHKHFRDMYPNLSSQYSDCC